jgi:hypothetical protein
MTLLGVPNIGIASRVQKPGFLKKPGFEAPEQSSFWGLTAFDLGHPDPDSMIPRRCSSCLFGGKFSNRISASST